MAITFGRSSITGSVLTGLGRSARAAGTAFERLGSGLRINRAADDAAGLAVASALGFRSRVLNRGRQNISDGLSALSIVDSTLDSVSTIMNRMSELAASAASGGVSPAQRQILAKEYQALDQEIRRVTGATQFNGLKLLQGTAKSETTGYLVDISNPPAVSGEALSSDGRYVTYRQIVSGKATIKQLDTSTGAITTILANGGLGAVTTAPVSNASGDTVVYKNGSNLFRWDRSTGTSTQITNAVTTESYANLSISADGGSVAFTAATRYVNGSPVSINSGSGTQRIYKLDLASNRISTVATDMTGTCSSFSLSPDGTRLVFTSSQNPIGTNSDANFEVFVADYSGSTPSYSQITQTTGPGTLIAAIADGGQVFFLSSDNVGGVNPGGNQNILKYNISSGSYQRLTNTSTGGVISLLTVNNDGSLVSFASTADQSGEGISGGMNQIYRLDTVNGEIRQATTLTDPDSFLVAAGGISRDGGTSLANIGNGDEVASTFYVLDIGAKANSFVVDTGNVGLSAISVSVSDLMATLRGQGGFAISSQSGARAALDRLQTNRDNLTALRGTIGAAMSRLETAHNLVSAHSSEYVGARGSIMNGDTADDVATMVRARILQDTGAQLLAAAKLQPDLALRLLRG